MSKDLMDDLDQVRDQLARAARAEVRKLAPDSQAEADIGEAVERAIRTSAVGISSGQEPVEAELIPGGFNQSAMQGVTLIRVSHNGKLVAIEKRGSDYPEHFERYGLNFAEFDVLIGRLLTLIDATFTDPEQRKAQKDVVRGAVRDWIADCARIARMSAGLEAGDPVSLLFDLKGGVEIADNAVTGAAEGSIAVGPGAEGEPFG